MNMTANRKGNSIQRFLQLVLLLVTGFVYAPLYAAVFTLDLTTNIFSGTVQNSTDAGGNVGKRWTSTPFSFSPVTLDQGDQLTLNIQFVADQSIEMISGAWFSGNENIAFLDGTFTGISVAGSSTLDSFVGLAGTLDAVLPVSTSFSSGNRIAGSIVNNLTDTALSFQGLSLNTNYTTLTGGPVTISSLELLVAADDIALNGTVPVPAAVWLFGSGLICLGGLARRTKT